MRALWAMAMIAAGILLPAGSGARAGQVELKVAVSHPVLLAGQKQTAYLKVGLTGVPLAVAEKRAPVNVALVLDRSGSMSGDKIRKAKEAAILAIHQLGPDDIVSVVAYNHGVTVLVPATKVSDRHVIYSAIDRLHADGTTALFAGVSKGAHEVRKFLSEDRVNRVILLSDGLANVGPSSPQALAALGASLIKEGISVTTIGLGLGYNEDLMFQLAHASEGNHVFVESSAHLARIFTREFGDLLSVVANEVEVEITCAEGIRPVRVLGRAADISGQRVTSKLNQLYGQQEKYILLEVEVDKLSAEAKLKAAEVAVSYQDVASRQAARLSGSASISFSESAQVVKSHTNQEVMIAAVEQISADNNVRAMMLRDQGKVDEARKVLQHNTQYLYDNAARYNSKRLQDYGVSNEGDAKNLSPGKWKKRRKEMREMQFEFMH
jgi:Ca-activated chloride channel family protein